MDTTLDLRVPPEARAILAGIRHFCPGAAIVGGYLRDLAAGVRPKDIDIFVPAPFSLPEVYFDNLRRVFHGGYGTGMREEVKRVYDLDIRGLSVQFVVNTAPTGRDAMMLVDFDFCRISYDGKAVVAGPGFARALETKTATFALGSGTQDMGRSRRRAERWKAGKFHDWTFSFPQEGSPLA